MDQSPTHAQLLAAQQIKNSFPSGAAIADFESACRFLNIARQTGDHWLSTGRFPVGTIRIGTRRIGVPIVLLQQWLEKQLLDAGLGNSDKPPLELHPEAIPAAPRRRGRPRKIPAAGAKK